MPSLGAPVLILILVIVLIVFGAGRLPQIGNALGRGIREFREATEDKPTPPPVVPPAAVGTPPTDETPTKL
jgi:sec-independent protein translocase protein TatA